MLRHINRIDIEFHSKCNRTCEWCPNSFLDRISEDKILDKEVYIKLLKDLKENNFGTMTYNTNSRGSVISFIGYEEPFLQIDLLKEYINIAKEIFDGINIDFIAHTNGDLITEDKLKNLPLSQLNIMDYDCRGEQYWKDKLSEMKCLLIKETDQLMTFVHSNVNVIQVFSNWPKKYFLENRGGSLDPSKLDNSLKWRNNAERREKRCIESIFYLNVYHNGDVTPCCHIRPDNPNHKDYIFGNLYDQSILDIFYSEKAVNFRNIMGHSRNKDIFFDPCKNCQKYRTQYPYSMTFEENGIRYPYIELVSIEPIEDEEFNNYIKTMEYWTDTQREIYSSFKPSIEFNDIEKFKIFYENHCTNLRALSYYYDYTYIDYPRLANHDHYDNSEVIDKLSDSYIHLAGFYLPFFGVSSLDKEKIFIFEGRKRYECLKYMVNKKFYTNKEILCFSIDEHKENFKRELLFPKEIIKLIEKLDLEYIDDSNDFIRIKTSNPINIFLILHIMQNEITNLIECHYEEIKNNIKPHPFINISKVGGVNFE